ncbi:MAG: hypothetical protein V1873_05235 [Verrucomicrobiota bacterium]
MLRKAWLGWAVGVAMVTAAGVTALGESKDAATTEKAQIPCKVYTDCEDEGISPFIPSGWMGSVDAIAYDDCCKVNPHSGQSCIMASFSDPKGWGGIVWQNPANNWGNAEGGVDLTGAKQLTFWARGDKGGETVDFKMGIVNKGKPYWDTAKGSLEKVKLSREWKQFTISLNGKDLSRIVSGFVFSTAGKKDPVVFYLDDILYE